MVSHAEYACGNYYTVCLSYHTSLRILFRVLGISWFRVFYTHGCDNDESLLFFFETKSCKVCPDA